MALTTMFPSKPGSPETTLTATITANATSMTVEDSSVLPAAPNICVIGSESDAEIVSYTGVNGNTLSGLVRAIGGTTASAWESGTIVARNFTSYDHDTFKSNIETLDNEKIDGVAWGDVTGTLSSQTDLQNALDAKQNTLTIDADPTLGSTNPVQSGGVYSQLALKAPLASPALTGTPTAPTASVATNTTQIATTEFVHLNGVYYGRKLITAGTTATFNSAKITSNMYLVSCIFETPNNVTSNVSWATASGSITFTGNFSGSTYVSFYLADPVEVE